MSLRPTLARMFLFLALVLVGSGNSTSRAGAETNVVPVAHTMDPITAAPPGRLGVESLDLVPALFAGSENPELILAQRAIERDLGTTPGEDYAVVDIPGWKSVGGATAMSLAIPGTGQLYTGHKRGYVYLGVEAIALVSYAAFNAKSDERRDDYYQYVGDPNDPSSRFSFERLGNQVSPEELSRLKTIYEKNQSEFYQAVTLQSQYAGGWSDPDDRFDAETIAEDSQKASGRQRFALYTLIANHLVSAFDALNLARFNNIALRENMTLKLKLRPSLNPDHGSYAFTLTQKF